MTSEISTQVVKIDLVEIHNNILNRDYWKRKWVVFDYDNVVITLRLGSIDVNNGKWAIRIEVKDLNNDDAWRNSQITSVTSTIDEPHFEIFEKSIVSAMHDLIRNHEYGYAYKSDHYKELVAKESAYSEASKEKLRAELDELGITHEEIREAYINEYYDTISLTGDYVASYKNKFMLSVHNQLQSMIEFSKGVN